MARPAQPARSPTDPLRRAPGISRPEHTPVRRWSIHSPRLARHRATHHAEGRPDDAERLLLRLLAAFSSGPGGRRSLRACPCPGTGLARHAPNPAKSGGLMSPTGRPIRVLELRSVRGTGGGPEKTIFFGA